MTGMSDISAGIALILVFSALGLFFRSSMIVTLGGIWGFMLILKGYRDIRDEEKRRKCLWCSFKATTPDGLIQHILVTHQANLTEEGMEWLDKVLKRRRFNCEFCGHWRTTKRELLEHILEKHEAELSVVQANRIRKTLGREMKDVRPYIS